MEQIRKKLKIERATKGNREQTRETANIIRVTEADERDSKSKRRQEKKSVRRQEYSAKNGVVDG